MAKDWEQQQNDPDWRQVVDLVGEFGPGSRFLVVGMQGREPVRTEIHRAVPEAVGYIRSSTWRNHEDPGVVYSWVFAGIRLYYHKERGTYLPFPPEAGEAGSTRGSSREE